MDRAPEMVSAPWTAHMGCSQHHGQRTWDVLSTMDRAQTGPPDHPTTIPEPWRDHTLEDLNLLFHGTLETQRSMSTSSSRIPIVRLR
ncbi:hypothetical protein GDO86_002817 [Hymenochirus boettgeri]|uniref:Uncharacterized protein n=1 Tax=Hymenochirus boettgeri TaxID=247094 RepID=A0A8T2K3V5_9PIPI|nr:hypothetical protein GDO86_002817 [Hymenochirus boettgeri]